MDELLSWLDAYELELAERDIREPIPKQLYRAWYVQAYSGGVVAGWCEFDELED